MFNIQTVVVSLLLVLIIVLLAFYVGKKGFKKRQGKKDRDEIQLSKKGSIAFYVVLFALLVFFVIMYIKWRIYLNV